MVSVHEKPADTEHANKTVMSLGKLGHQAASHLLRLSCANRRTSSAIGEPLQPSENLFTIGCRSGYRGVGSTHVAICVTSGREGKRV
jgi:hypothetical protein